MHSRAKKKRLRTLMAALTASAAIISGLTINAVAENSGGHGDEGGGGSEGSATVVWKYNDAWPATRQAVINVMTEAGFAPFPAADLTVIDKAINGALGMCRANYTGSDTPDCRMVAVGFVGVYKGTAGNSRDGWNSTGTWYADKPTSDPLGKYVAGTSWKEKWHSDIMPNTYYYQGNPYTTGSPWIDNNGRHTLDQMAFSGIDNKPEAAVRVIVLAKNQPLPPEYELSVTTSQSSTPAMKVGDTSPVKDVIHTDRGSSTIDENVNANVILHYDGQPDGYVAATSATKTISIPNHGDTTSPEFTPSDLGMNHWQEGTYWFDIQVPKQGKMKEAVDTADREATESFTVSPEPPTDLDKVIEEGVSASQMVNRTRITVNTGKGGYEATFKDVINPNGVTYTISNYTLTDLTSGEDVASEYSINWNQDTNEVTAVRTADKGEMPLNHDIEFAFDVTVDKPDFSTVQDHGEYTWNHQPTISTEPRQFDTWQPNPDKAWIIKGADGTWQAVIDPKETNTVGGDGHTYKDGDTIASVVNGTVSQNLIDKPETFILTDDYGNADYIFDPGDIKDYRVYQAEAATDRESSVIDIVNHGTDVTDQFTIKREGTTVTATANDKYLSSLQKLDKPLQVTLLIPGVINYANGKGAAQVREDFNVAEGDELTFCTNPNKDGQNGHKLTNAGSEQLNDHILSTNEPGICGYVPPVKKDVVSEASQGGTQESINGKTVFPGQKVEYQLLTEPHIPGDLAYSIDSVGFTDTYDEYLTVDKQTLEIADLTTGKTISKKNYTTQWNDDKHSVNVQFTSDYIKANWQPGQTPRLMLRFEGTVRKDAPTSEKIDNQWWLHLDNSITPSNKVHNDPPEFPPLKDVTQSENTISVDGKTFLLGDTFNYRIDLNLTDLPEDQQAYKIWRAGLIDDWDDDYLSLDEKAITIIDKATGEDVTSKFNIHTDNGITYAFAKTVDTYIETTGETVPGDPQPEDLKAYAKQDYDPLKDAAIDQALLGHTYQLILPMTVKQVDDGYTVENTATALVNDQKKETNKVTNPLEPINPSKDVVVTVNGDSINNTDILLHSTFLYQLDSSVLPPNRAYPEVTQWEIVDPLPTQYDRYTGQWAVYATRDLYKDGGILAHTGDRIAGSDFNTSEALGLDNDLFTANYSEDGTFTVTATDTMLALVSANTTSEQAWRTYIQAERIATGEHITNQFTERINGKDIPSNTVETNTKDQQPGIHVEKFDKESGWPQGDRDSEKEALTMPDGTATIIFRITNTGDVPLKALNLNDQTIAGDGTVTINYPEGWNDTILQPGDSVDVEGTLTGVTQTHTDRVTAEGTPINECPYIDDNPFDDKPGTKADNCDGEKVISNADDWNGKREELPHTGAALGAIWLIATASLGAGGAMLLTRRQRRKETSTM